MFGIEFSNSVPFKAKKTVLAFSLGFFAGVLATFLGFGVARRYRQAAVAVEPPSVCYSCLWEGYDPKLRSDLVNFYRQYRTNDPLVAADVRYILWRATGNPNCDARQVYRRVAQGGQDFHRRLMASAILGFGAPECGQDGSADLKAAAEFAEKAGQRAQASLLRLLSSDKLQARFEQTKIVTSLDVPGKATTIILGETTIEVPEGLRVGTQVDRVARDWISYQMGWDLTPKPVPASSVIDYHEGALVRRLMELASVEVYPLAGTLVARKGDQWFAPDENGIFRFAVLEDKLQYPTTHVAGSFGWVEDTHGISLLAVHALQRRLPLVLGCGDSAGKAEAAFYLAERGVNVVFPGDRYQDLLLGYQGKGLLIGTAPVKKVGNRVIIGGQPVSFLLAEPIVVQDTKAIFPIQYYDAAARYFRRLSTFVPLHLTYVSVDAPNQISRILQEAQRQDSAAVAVRVATKPEYETLREWLAASPKNRAILFHSGLYPYAQPLFEEFPRQVTFGDLRPHFE